MFADEYLRKSRTAICPLDHLLAQLRVHGGVQLVKGYSLRLQQAFGSAAISAHPARIDLDVWQWNYPCLQF